MENNFIRQREVRNALKPLFLLSEHISMCPLSLSNGNSKNISYMRLSRKGLLSSIVLMIFYLYCYYESYKMITIIKDIGMDIFTIIGNSLQVLSGTVSVATVVLEIILCGKYIPKWFYKLCSTDQELDCFRRTKYNYQYLCILNGILISIALIILFALFCISSVVTYLVTGYVAIYNMNLIILPNLHSFLSTLRYISKLYLISQRIANANVFMGNIQKDIMWHKRIVNNEMWTSLETLEKKTHCVLKNTGDYYDLFEMTSKMNELVNVITCLSLLIMTMFTCFYTIYNPLANMPMIRYLSFFAMCTAFGFMHFLLFYLLTLSTKCTLQVRVLKFLE